MELIQKSQVPDCSVLGHQSGGAISVIPTITIHGIMACLMDVAVHALCSTPLRQQEEDAWIARLSRGGETH